MLTGYTWPTKRSDLHSQSSDMISAPQYMVAFLDVGVDESYVQILQQVLEDWIRTQLKRKEVIHLTLAYKIYLVHINLTVPSIEALAILVPEAENLHLEIGLVCPKNVSCEKKNLLAHFYN